MVCVQLAFAIPPPMALYCPCSHRGGRRNWAFATDGFTSDFHG